MPQISHFAINATDLAKARYFYENVFQWTFEAWGPPGFYMIGMTPDGMPAEGLRASLQGRREIVPGVAMKGFECTIGVEDVEATARAIEAYGGRIVMPVCELAGIGRLLFFEDPDGNIAGAMQYESGH